MIWKVVFGDDLSINLSSIDDVLELVGFFQRLSVKYGTCFDILIKGEKL